MTFTARSRWRPGSHFGDAENFGVFQVLGDPAAEGVGVAALKRGFLLHQHEGDVLLLDRVLFGLRAVIIDGYVHLRVVEADDVGGGEVVVHDFEDLGDLRDGGRLRGFRRRIAGDGHQFDDIDDLGDPLQDGRFLDGGGVGEGADDGEQGHDESELQEDDPLVVEGGFLCFLRFHGFGVLCCFVRCKGTDFYPNVIG